MLDCHSELSRRNRAWQSRKCSLARALSARDCCGSLRSCLPLRVLTDSILPQRSGQPENIDPAVVLGAQHPASARPRRSCSPDRRLLIYTRRVFCRRMSFASVRALPGSVVAPCLFAPPSVSSRSACSGLTPQGFPKFVGLGRRPGFPPTSLFTNLCCGRAFLGLDPTGFGCRSLPGEGSFGLYRLSLLALEIPQKLDPRACSEGPTRSDLSRAQRGMTSHNSDKAQGRLYLAAFRKRSVDSLDSRRVSPSGQFCAQSAPTAPGGSVLGEGGSLRFAPPQYLIAGYVM